MAYWLFWNFSIWKFTQLILNCTLPSNLGGSLSMNSGKTVFAQILQHISRYEFNKCVTKYNGNHRIRAFPCYDQFFLPGIRPINISRKLTRYRNMSQLASRKIIPCGLSGPSIEINALRCQRTSRLPDIPRVWILSHQHSAKTLPQRRLGSGTVAISICPRFDNHRSLSLSVSMGDLPKDQVSHQDPYAPGFARFNPHVHQPDPRYSSRCNHAGRSPIQTTIDRYHGPRVHWLQAVICDSSTPRLLRYSCKEQSEISPSHITKGGQNVRTSGRSNNHPHRCQVKKRVPGDLTTGIICRPGNTQTFCVPDQYLFTTSRTGSRHLQTTLEHRAVFQMGQTPSQDKIILKDIIQSSQNPDLGCYQCLFARCNYEKAA